VEFVTNVATVYTLPDRMGNNQKPACHSCTSRNFRPNQTLAPDSVFQRPKDDKYIRCRPILSMLPFFESLQKRTFENPGMLKLTARSLPVVRVVESHAG
jgi:hypothetical protein